MGRLTKAEKRKHKAKGVTLGRPKIKVRKESTVRKQKNSKSLKVIEINRILDHMKDQLMSKHGVPIGFEVRRLLLVIMINTLRSICKDEVEYGVQNLTHQIGNMKPVFEFVTNLSGVSAETLRCIWNSTSYDKSEDVVTIEVPNFHEEVKTDIDLEEKKLQTLTVPHIKAMSAYIDWSNDTYGNVSVLYIHLLKFLLKFIFETDDTQIDSKLLK